jgi:light-regulated signal transduction histidine kinase (bacteriophytochrome)
MPASPKQIFEQRLKKLSADFEFFAHVTSHDLRDPLRQARIYSDELFNELPSQETRQKLESINKLIDCVLEKIALLHDFSYIANDKEKHTKVDLNKLAASILIELADKIKSTNADIKIAKLPIISGNEKHLRRLFLALIDNAIKFRNNNIPPRIMVDAIKEGSGTWHFTISDNGIGLDKVYRELVFVLFQKLDNETENKADGTGLAFAKKIVENHGGTIWYESDGENGTVFHFTVSA